MSSSINFKTGSILFLSFLILITYSSVLTAFLLHRRFEQKHTGPVSIIDIPAVQVPVQTRRSVDWKPCIDFESQFKAQVDKFNTDHPGGPQISFDCVYSGDRNRTKLPEQHIALTPTETVHLHELRRAEDTGFKAIDEYEKYLFQAHHVHEPRPGDACFYFVGFVLDEDFITIDPNPLAGQPYCSATPERGR